MELSAYADGECGAADRAAVEAHLAACDDCRRTLDAWRSVGDALRGAEEPRAFVALSAAVRGELARTRPAPLRVVKARRGVRVTTGAAALAATVILAIGIARPRASAEDDGRFAEERDGNQYEAAQQRSRLDLLRLELTSSILKAQQAGASADRMMQLQRESDSILADADAIGRSLYAVEARLASGAGRRAATEVRK